MMSLMPTTLAETRNTSLPIGAFVQDVRLPTGVAEKSDSVRVAHANSVKTLGDEDCDLNPPLIGDADVYDGAQALLKGVGGCELCKKQPNASKCAKCDDEERIWCTDEQKEHLNRDYTNQPQPRTEHTGVKPSTVQNPQVSSGTAQVYAFNAQSNQAQPIAAPKMIKSETGGAADLGVKLLREKYPPSYAIANICSQKQVVIAKNCLVSIPRQLWIKARQARHAQLLPGKKGVPKNPNKVKIDMGLDALMFALADIQAELATDRTRKDKMDEVAESKQFTCSSSYCKDCTRGLSRLCKAWVKSIVPITLSHHKGCPCDGVGYKFIQMACGDLVVLPKSPQAVHGLLWAFAGHAQLIDTETLLILDTNKHKWRLSDPLDTVKSPGHGDTDMPAVVQPRVVKKESNPYQPIGGQKADDDTGGLDALGVAGGLDALGVAAEQTHEEPKQQLSPEPPPMPMHDTTDSRAYHARDTTHRASVTAYVAFLEHPLRVPVIPIRPAVGVVYNDVWNAVFCSLPFGCVDRGCISVYADGLLQDEQAHFQFSQRIVIESNIDHKAAMRALLKPSDAIMMSMPRSDNAVVLHVQGLLAAFDICMSLGSTVGELKDAILRKLQSTVPDHKAVDKTDMWVYIRDTACQPLEPDDCKIRQLAPHLHEGSVLSYSFASDFTTPAEDSTGISSSGISLSRMSLMRGRSGNAHQRVLPMRDRMDLLNDCVEAIGTAQLALKDSHSISMVGQYVLKQLLESLSSEQKDKFCKKLLENQAVEACMEVIDRVISERATAVVSPSSENGDEIMEEEKTTEEENLRKRDPDLESMCSGNERGLLPLTVYSPLKKTENAHVLKYILEICIPALGNRWRTTLPVKHKSATKRVLDDRDSAFATSHNVETDHSVFVHDSLSLEAQLDQPPPKAQKRSFEYEKKIIRALISEELAAKEPLSDEHGGVAPRQICLSEAGCVLSAFGHPLPPFVQRFWALERAFADKEAVRERIDQFEEWRKYQSFGDLPGVQDKVELYLQMAELSRSAGLLILWEHYTNMLRLCVLFCEKLRGRKNLNAEYQRLLGSSETEKLKQLKSEFRTAANVGAQIIVAQRHLPVEQHLIAAVDAGGMGGGTKYTAGHILFKFCSRSSVFEQLPQSQHLGRKTAHLELIASEEIQRLQSVIKVPQSEACSVRGEMVFATAMVELQRAEPCVGSRDAGKHVHCDDADLSTAERRALEKIVDELHLKKHLVLERSSMSLKELSLAVDVELVRGTDGFLYFLDVARLLPPTPPEEETPLTFLTQHYRPEFMRELRNSSAARLHADVYSSFVNCMENEEVPDDVKARLEAQEKEDVMHAKQAWELQKKQQRLLAERLDSAAPDRIPSIETGIDISQLFHSMGVNMRYCVNVAQLCQNSAAVDRLILEHVCRRIKGFLRGYLREHSPTVGVAERFLDWWQFDMLEDSFNALHTSATKGVPESFLDRIGALLRRPTEAIVERVRQDISGDVCAIASVAAAAAFPADTAEHSGEKSNSQPPVSSRSSLSPAAGAQEVPKRLTSPEVRIDIRQCSGEESLSGGTSTKSCWLRSCHMGSPSTVVLLLMLLLLFSGADMYHGASCLAIMTLAVAWSLSPVSALPGSSALLPDWTLCPGSEDNGTKIWNVSRGDCQQTCDVSALGLTICWQS